MNKKPVLATAFISVVLFSGLVGLCFVNLAVANFIPPPNHASGIFIRSDGRVDPSTASIQRLGDIYTFTGDVSVGIAVQRSDVIIDGNGYQLLGGNGGTGFYLQSVNNVTLQNVNVQRFNYGFYLDNTRSSTVKGNDITRSGIVVTQGSCYNQVVGNTVVGGGISLNFGNDNIVIDNNVSGISIVFSTNITVGNNRIANDKRVDVNLLYTGEGGGIYIDNSGKCNIFGNTIERKIIGINIWHCTNLNFSNNILKDNQVGFKLWGSDLQHNLHSIGTSNTIEGKPVYFLVNQSDFQVPNNAGWIAAVNCVNITVENWVSTPNWDSILFIETRDSKIIRSNLTGNFNGIMLRDSSNCLVSQNLIKNNQYAALYLDETVDCTITENDIENNFCIFGIRHGSERNILFHNNFIDNGWIGAFDHDCQNIWDNGSEGNYWNSYDQRASYMGVDENGDGIGDTPHVIDSYSGNADNYPLMAPFKTPKVIPEFPQWVPILIMAMLLMTTSIPFKRRLHRRTSNRKRLSLKHRLLERR